MTKSRSKQVLLSVQDLKVTFRLGKDETVAALKGVSFEVTEDSAVGLVGESGSGKTVAALAVMGLLPEQNARIDAGGQVLFQGKNLLRESREAMRARRGSEISMIFQEPMSSLNPVYTAGNQIAEVLRLH